MGNVVRNSQLFDQWLHSCGLTYKDVYRCLNENGITDFNNVISKSGILLEEDDSDYSGRRDYHGCDEGLRTHAEKDLDCAIGNIQERLFCIDNKDFRINETATHNGDIRKDTDITTRRLDFIHIPTGKEVEFKVSYCKTINAEYDTVIYRHRDGKFADFMRNGNIIYFPYLDKVAVFDKNNFMDPDKHGPKRSVRIIKTEEQYGKLWNIVSIWKGMLMDYHMMKEGNGEISEKIIRLCANKIK